MKREGKNKSGVTLAKEILKNTRGKLSEKAKENTDYEGTLKKYFSHNFLKYYELLTNKQVQFGDFTDAQFDDLKEKLVTVTKNCYLDNLCEWFKVEKWQDFFPINFTDFEELAFKRSILDLIMEFYIKNHENEYDVKESMRIKKQIYQLMEMDYYQYIRKNESTDKSEALNLAKKRRNIHKEILKERESARNEEERNIIKKYINSNQESQMTSREYRYIQEPEFAELFDWCKMNYKKYRPEIDIKNDKVFNRWFDKQVEWLKNEQRKRYKQEL